MTEKDASNLIKLLRTKKQDIKLEADDSEILKAVVFNMALRESEQLILAYQRGEIELDVLNEL